MTPHPHSAPPTVASAKVELRTPHSAFPRTQAFLDSARFILHRRRAGKIAHLPQAVRDRINLMLRDGVPYAVIITNLGDSGRGLNKDNLSRWRKADHQDWLVEQTWQAALGNRPEPTEQTKQIALLLHDMDSDTLKETLARNPDKFVPTMNLMARCYNHVGELP